MDEKSIFYGKVFDSVVCNIVCGIINSFTLGICFPWALCMQKTWESNNTVINGKKLIFNGKGEELFKDWIKWYLLIIVTFGIYKFWVSVKLQQWITSHTHFEN